jgi:hypothetical protein
MLAQSNLKTPRITRCLCGAKYGGQPTKCGISGDLGDKLTRQRPGLSDTSGDNVDHESLIFDGSDAFRLGD